MSLITVVTGHENNKAASAQIYIFQSPIGDDYRNRDFTEMPLSKLSRDTVMIKDEIICRKHGSTTMIPAVDATKEDIGGCWYQQTYDIREGTVLKIFASLKQSWNGVKSMANLFIRVREKAALMKVSVKLIGLPSSKLSTGEITGRFDLIPMQEAVDMGAKIHPSFASSYTAAAVVKLFTATELEEAVSVKPSIISTTVEGGHVVRVRRKGRSLEL